MNPAVEILAQLLTIAVNGTSNLLFSLLCGLFCSLLWGSPPHKLQPQLRISLNIAGGLFSFVITAQLWLLALSMLGTSRPTAVLPQLTDILQTHAGEVLLFEFLIAVLLACTFRLSLARLYLPLATVLFLLLSIIRAASGHASADGNLSLREFTQWMHLVSSGIWSGGVIVSSRFLFRSTAMEISQVARERLARQSLIAVLFVALSGSGNTWLSANGAITFIPHAPWGRILILKLVLVGATLCIGATNHRLILHVETPVQRSRFTRLLRIESWMMIAILFVSAWLATTPPIGE